MNQEQFLKMILDSFKRYYGATNFTSQCIEIVKKTDLNYKQFHWQVYIEGPVNISSYTRIEFTFIDRDSKYHKEELKFNETMNIETIKKVFREVG